MYKTVITIRPLPNSYFYLAQLCSFFQQKSTGEKLWLYLGQWIKWMLQNEDIFQSSDRSIQYQIFRLDLNILYPFSIYTYFLLRLHYFKFFCIPIFGCLFYIFKNSKKCHNIDESFKVIFVQFLERHKAQY